MPIKPKKWDFKDTFKNYKANDEYGNDFIWHYYWNSFKPNENITRGEVAEILFNVLKFYDAEKSKKYDYGNAFYNFSDADKFGKFDEAIKQLASNNIINGYEDKTFRADKNITRAEVAKIIFYASDRESNLGQKIYSDLNKNYWAYKFLMDASA